MTNQTQAIRKSGEKQHGPLELAQTAQPDVLAEEQSYRAGAYELLAALLRRSPDQAVLDRIADLPTADAGDELTLAISMLSLSAATSNPSAVDDEFHSLFIGIGRGELVPYGSWYLTGFLMERPLGSLRDDLIALGFQRSEEVCEPEDHAAALCEVMAMLINDDNRTEQQAAFFKRHIEAWFERFFCDLSQAKSAVFYRAVGRFGAAFSNFDRRYLAMSV